MWWRRLRYVLALIGLASLATCPAAVRSCKAKNRSREAEQLLTALGDRVARAVATTGKVPPTPAGPSPVASCCDHDGVCSPNDATWADPGWRELAFTIDTPYRYTYQYIPDASGSRAVVRAVGDLDCNGTKSVYELRLSVDGTTVRRTWHRENPYE